MAHCLESSGHALPATEVECSAVVAALAAGESFLLSLAAGVECWYPDLRLDLAVREQGHSVLALADRVHRRHRKHREADEMKWEQERCSSVL